MSSMGTADTANALRNLWEAAAGTLTPEQLQWFGSLDDFARMEAMNLSATLSTLANLTDNVDEVDRPNREELTKILYSTSYQIETIASLIDIASSAKDRLWNPEGYETVRKAKSGGWPITQHASPASLPGNPKKPVAVFL